MNEYELQKHYIDGLKCCERNLEEKNTKKILRQMIVCCDVLGSISLEKDRFAESLRYYEKMNLYSLMLLEKSRTCTSYKLSMISNSRISDVYMAVKDYDNAMKNLIKAVKYGGRMISKTDKEENVLLFEKIYDELKKVYNK